jgi:hypothetical protein
MDAKTAHATVIVQAILDDLMNRAGIDDLLMSIDFDTFNEMGDDLIEIVESHL